MPKVITEAAAATSTAPPPPSFDLDMVNRALALAQTDIEDRKRWLSGQLMALQLVFNAMLTAPPSNVKDVQGILDATVHAIDCMDVDVDQLKHVRSLLASAGV